MCLRRRGRGGEGGEAAADRVYSTRGCFVDAFELDIAGLEISREEISRLDVMFHLLLHAGRQAWGDVVTVGVDRKRVGVIIGNIALPTDGASAYERGDFGAVV